MLVLCAWLHGIYIQKQIFSNKIWKYSINTIPPHVFIFFPNVDYLLLKAGSLENKSLNKNPLITVWVLEKYSDDIKIVVIS
jgi:hypothetical protein